MHWRQIVFASMSSVQLWVEREREKMWVILSAWMHCLYTVRVFYKCCSQFFSLHSGSKEQMCLLFDLVFWAVVLCICEIQYSHNFELLFIFVYIWIIIVILQPPYGSYGDESFTQKDSESKNGYTCFFVFQYYEMLSNHTTSNFSIYRYLYI